MTTAYDKFRDKWKECGKCLLYGQRRRACLARGSVPCDVLFIGEAPGVSEDVIGRPFVGPAGHLLDRIIAHAMQESAFYRFALTNLVACFPKEAKREGVNEPPEEAIKACLPRLYEFVNVCRPRLIVFVGRLAAKWIPGAASFRFDGKPKQPDWVAEGKCLEFIQIVHPAAILRADITQRALQEKRATVILRNALQTL